ncbi:forkhead box Q2 [Alosa alosa]|uniref:forkhead box Q2 n=1 Tax=Alosa alosa TaxID=278164 RepID=UPI0020151614|nr:forkhead box Q2 [Alosa alosa]
MEESGINTESRGLLGLRFTIDYLLFNKGAKSEWEGSEMESTNVSKDSPDTQDSQREETPRDEEECPKSASPEMGTDASEEDNDEEVKGEGAECSDGQEDKPTQSYIALISMAILASEEKKLLLCDIYQWIMDHYPYFKNKDKNWRNSVRHNLSLNECFIKAGRSENGKGHFWAIHPANYEDFSKGEYHRRRARRRIRRVVGQLPYPLMSPYHPLHRLKGAPCWCCPPNHQLPYLPPGIYWGLAALQARRNITNHALL